MWPMLLILVSAAMVSGKKLTYYLDFEHPNVTYMNTKYYEYVKITAQRYTRRDPIHYLNIHGKTLIEFGVGDDTVVDGYVYEFLSNEYRRSMIEVHYSLCNVFSTSLYNSVVKPLFMKYTNKLSCPFPKGDYHWVNLSVPNLPLLKTFPFQKGRVFMKAYNKSNGESFIEGYVDASIKQRFL